MTKKYDVTGIGNALVDIEFEVSDPFLDKYGIEKGLMTLVDEDRQGELMSAINTKTSKLQCGGSAANSIIAVSQFGGKSYYCCKVANDELGRFFIEDMKEAGVNHNLDPFKLEEGITGKCLVMVTADAERTMNTFLGITEKFSTSQINEEAIKDSKYLYIEGYLITSENAKEAMMSAKKIAEENNVKVAITFSDPAMVKYFGESFKEVIGSGVDMLFANEEEAMLYTGKDNLSEAGEELKKIAKHFVITQGKNGALIYDGETFIDIAPYPTVAVDTNGAGDMFAGAFMYGITNGHSYASSGKLASMASSKIVSQFGPRLSWEEAKAVLSRLQP
ncbi:adenosine kinase [Cyclobacterium amurskyense]|jgi:sugar/nucleoside kinase (ribokinase family)|uniref:PfkB domain protein n=1 Tax=Cyclobacterium amurskyense TaxID=320787 RepID=A0A0H4P985_9BACT|nr:adenosine kinase [Cyclobacterium amurskyense]AKP50714.1 PfkB domain protein [Cyclobacterium amurskyense]|tara:strand:+ start:28585 stop:29583 length:999 start_codon:yes stop_codon:yes gene_type:complete